MHMKYNRMDGHSDWGMVSMSTGVLPVALFFCSGHCIREAHCSQNFFRVSPTANWSKWHILLAPTTVMEQLHVLIM